MLLSTEFGFLTIKKGDAQQGWREISVSDYIVVYFRSIGTFNYIDFDGLMLGDDDFLHHASMVDETPYGIYEHFEYYEF